MNALKRERFADTNMRQEKESERRVDNKTNEWKMNERQ